VFIAYVILTGLVVLSQFASGVLDLMEAEALVKGVTALGYPVYILKILGPAKIAGTIVLACPVNFDSKNGHTPALRSTSSGPRLRTC